MDIAHLFAYNDSLRPKITKNVEKKNGNCVSDPFNFHVDPGTDPHLGIVDPDPRIMFSGIVDPDPRIQLWV